MPSALWFKHVVSKDIRFVAWDIDLLKAAKAEKLRVINPQVG